MACFLGIRNSKSVTPRHTNLHPHPPKIPPKTGHNAQTTQPRTITVTHPHKIRGASCGQRRQRHNRKTENGKRKARRLKKTAPDSLSPDPSPRPCRPHPPHSVAGTPRSPSLPWLRPVPGKASFAVTASLYLAPAGHDLSISGTRSTPFPLLARLPAARGAII